MKTQIVVAAAVALLCSCAHVTELPDGSRRVTGFVRMTVPASIPQGQRGADSLEVTTVGLLLLSTPAGGSLSVGYASERITTVRNDALVRISDPEEAP
jgi:hypothetical protein